MKDKLLPNVHHLSTKANMHYINQLKTHFHFLPSDFKVLYTKYTISGQTKSRIVSCFVYCIAILIVYCNTAYIVRYYGAQKRSDYLGSLSSGVATDFRHYNYRRVPYLGGSDAFRYLNKMVVEAVHWTVWPNQMFEFFYFWSMNSNFYLETVDIYQEIIR